MCFAFFFFLDLRMIFDLLEAAVRTVSYTFLEYTFKRQILRFLICGDFYIRPTEASHLAKG